MLPKVIVKHPYSFRISSIPSYSQFCSVNCSLYLCPIIFIFIFIFIFMERLTKYFPCNLLTHSHTLRSYAEALHGHSQLHKRFKFSHSFGSTFTKTLKNFTLFPTSAAGVFLFIFLMISITSLL